jgi:class 3 adenylate cyclase
MQAQPTGHDAGMPVSRRLAAITFVDIAGYTVLMATDETRTHQRWMTILNEVIRPQAERYHGTVVKSTGDGVLAEFPSVHDAVEWARNVQQLVVPSQTDRDDAVPSIALRISVHFADIITTEFDVFGDGVNVAARLQEHAEPGGIVLHSPKPKITALNSTNYSKEMRATEWGQWPVCGTAIQGRGTQEKSRR